MWVGHARRQERISRRQPEQNADDAAQRTKVIASMRNWRRMSRPCAPTAMRMPISRVRSVTLTSMMFMMPMPPTMSETLAIEPRSMVMTFEVAVAVSAISCWLRTVKSSSRPGRCCGAGAAAR